MLEDSFIDEEFDVAVDAENALLNEFYNQGEEDYIYSFRKRHRSNIEEIDGCLPVFKEDYGRDF